MAGRHGDGGECRRHVRRHAGRTVATAAQARAGEAAPAAAEVALFRAEAAARFARLATTDNGLVERLTLFWSNHFAVSAAKGNTLRVLAGPFEREAIRPYVLGRFARHADGGRDRIRRC